MADPIGVKYKWTVLTVTTVGVLMSGIDGRIVIIGLPTVASALHADAEQAIWFTQSYTIGSTVALLFIGRVSDIFGRVKIYSFGFSIFTIGSLLAGTSSESNFFILSRIIQGLGAAALFANSAAIITDAFPHNQLGAALGINQIAFRVGSVTGLTLSGLILAILDWRYLFYINVPVGIFATVWAVSRLRQVGTSELGTPWDWKGFISFTIFITSLLLALTFAAYGFTDYLTVAVLGILTLTSLALFVHFEHHVNHPLLDLSILRIKEFAGGSLAQMINAIATGAFILVISLYLQLVLGLSPLQAGLGLLPFDLGFIMTGPISGRLSDKYGALPFTTSGLLATSLALFLFAGASPNSAYSYTGVLLLLAGAGMGLFSSPNVSSIMGSVPPIRRGVASALRGTFYNVGYTLSFNVAILLMELKIPYSLITNIISSMNSVNVTLVERVSFSNSLHIVYLILAIVNGLAVIPSIIGGRTNTSRNG